MSTSAAPAKPRTAVPLALAFGFVALALAAMLLLNALRPKPPAAAVGGVAQQGTLAVTAESLECSTSPLPANAAGGAPLSPAGQFCVATLRVADTAAQHRLQAGQQRLRTTDGKEYRGSAEANSDAHTKSADVAVRPGQEARVQVAFDVPAGVRPVQLVVDLDGRVAAVFTA